MKTIAFVAPAIFLVFILSSCDGNKDEQPSGITARFNGVSWSTSDIAVYSAVNGVNIYKMVATGEDHTTIIFRFDQLGLTQFNRTTSFRAKGATLNSLGYQVLDDNNAVLQWQTQNEENIYYFKIEWSTDNANFSYLDVVYPQGTPSSTTNYTYPISVSNMSDRTIFVRITIVDYNGNYTYSPTLSVTTAFPVTVADVSGKRWKAYDGNIQLTEFDMEEKILSGTFYFKFKDSSGNEVAVTEGKINKVRF